MAKVKTKEITVKEEMVLEGRSDDIRESVAVQPGNFLSLPLTYCEIYHWLNLSDGSRVDLESPAEHDNYRAVWRRIDGETWKTPFLASWEKNEDGSGDVLVFLCEDEDGSETEGYGALLDWINAQ